MRLPTHRMALLVATVLSGLSAGFFYTYQVSVIRGLDLVDDTNYVATFQAINETIRNPMFGLVFWGTVPAVAYAFWHHQNADAREQGGPARRLIAYALGLAVAVIMVTGTGSLPLNRDLADLDNVTPESAAIARDEFEDDWNQYNLVRTLLSAGSFVCLAGALALGDPAESDRKETLTDRVPAEV